MIPGTGIRPSDPFVRPGHDHDLPAAHLRRRSGRHMSRRCHHGSARHAHLGPLPRRPRSLTPEPPARPAGNGHAALERALPTDQVSEPRELSSPVEATDWTIATDPIKSALPPPEGVEPGSPTATRRAIGTSAFEATSPAPPRHEAAPAPLSQRPNARRPAGSEPRNRPSVPKPNELTRHSAPRAMGDRASAAPPPGHANVEDDGGMDRGATGPQLRRFIKSRAYVPMHELRRRFAINGGDDEVTPVDIERHRIFVGLPEREGRLLGELLRAGDIGYELSLDPISPIVVGVYPMRPVTRP